MTKQEKAIYQDCSSLKRIILTLKGQKYRLDCGHHVTFGHALGNDITIRQNGQIVCSLCGYHGE